jgi:competence protein ComEC
MNVTWLRRLVKRGGVAGVVIAGAILLARALAGRRHRWLLVTAGLLLLGGLILLPGSHRLLSDALPSNPLRVTFLDVGKGDAIVIETTNGAAAVVDAGGTLRGGGDQAGRTIIPYLRSRGIRSIGALILTHPHPDHIGGAATLIEQFPIAFLLDNGVDSTLPEYRRYRDAARAHKVEYHQMRRGTAVTFGDGVRLTAIAPPRSLAQGRTNNTSIVLRLEYGNNVFLLTGDAEAESESEMLRSGQPLACDVLKVGHHGSKQSSSPEFVAAARPRIAIISVDANNRNGYPAPEVLERLKRAGAEIYRTDQHGAITCIADGKEIRVETARR